MALLPQSQRDQVKFGIGFLAVALAVAFYVYPYTSRQTEITAQEQRVAELEDANHKAAREFANGSIELLRSEASKNRSTLVVMRRLVPTGNEVPALLEEVSTAARQAGLDVGGVTPEPVIPGDRFDTYRYTVTILGGYHQFGRFLANVGSLPRIVAPVNFSIVGKGAQPGVRPMPLANNGTLSTTITLQTYVERTSPLKRPAPHVDGVAGGTVVIVPGDAHDETIMRRIAQAHEAQARETQSHGAQAQHAADAEHEDDAKKPHDAKAAAGDTASIGAHAEGSAEHRPTEFTIEREVFEYEAGGRRDPYRSLMSSSDVRPLLSDLRLTAVAFDPDGDNSVAILRDSFNKQQYRVRIGQQLGRLRVTAIRQKSVQFTMEEFGFNRQETLALAGDTTKVRNP